MKILGLALAFWILLSGLSAAASGKIQILTFDPKAKSSLLPVPAQLRAILNPFIRGPHHMRTNLYEKVEKANSETETPSLRVI